MSAIGESTTNAISCDRYTFVDEEYGVPVLETVAGAAEWASMIVLYYMSSFCVCHCACTWATINLPIEREDLCQLQLELQYSLIFATTA